MTPAVDAVNEEAPESSLFNLDTFKQLLAAGAQVADVAADNSADISNLDEVMGDLKTKLQLDSV